MQSNLNKILSFIAFLIMHASLYARTYNNRYKAITSECRSHPIPIQTLYLSIDKNIYCTGEKIWFAAWLLQSPAVPDSLQPDIVSVALVRSGDTSNIAIKKNYLLQKGLCSGSLTLPKDVPPGDYQLIAFTNLFDQAGKPLYVYHRPIEVKLSQVPPFFTGFSILSQNKDSTMINVQIRLDNGSRAVGGGNSITFSLSHQKPQVIGLNFTGHGIIRLPTPEFIHHNLLHTVSTYGKEQLPFNIKLPPPDNDTLNIKFYPEGGDLVTGLPSQVGCEVKDYYGQPQKAKIILLENTTLIDTLQTDKKGLCIFSLTPRYGTQYSVKAITDSGAQNNISYPLPLALSEGIVTSLPNNLANDSLVVVIRAQKPQSVKLYVSDIYQNKRTGPIVLQIAGEKRINVPLGDFEKGLHLFPVADAQNRPLTENLFFAHYNESPVISIQTNKAEYTTRDSVMLIVKLKDRNMHPTKGLATISCTRTNRIDSMKMEDVASFYYFNRLIGGSGNIKLDTSNAKREEIEKVLLVRGWRRYTWQQLKERAYIGTFKKLQVRGRAKYYPDRKLKKPVNIIVGQEDAIHFILTDNNGNFSPSPSEIAIPENRSVFLKVVGEQHKYLKYMIDLQYPLDTHLNRIYYNTHILPVSHTQQSITQYTLQDGREVAHNLETVTITAKNKYYGYGKGFTNSCGDYVCPEGFINCFKYPADDPGTTLPVKGKMYLFSINDSLRYEGCPLDEPPAIAYIYKTRDFYAMDSSMLNNTSEKAFVNIENGQAPPIVFT